MMVASLIFGTILAVLLTVASLKNNRPAKIIASGYITFFRSTPELVQLYLIFFGMPQILTLLGIDISNWSAVTFAIITFSLNVAAYLSEVMRSAYLSVEPGQQDAAFSIGMSNLQVLQRVVLPQAFAVALPNLGNTFIILLKDTSLAFTIGVIDIMGMAQIISARDFGVAQVEIYIVVSLIYWAMCVMLEQCSAYFEKIYKLGSEALT
jgi:L-cystine transport system permease protein